MSAFDQIKSQAKKLGKKLLKKLSPLLIKAGIIAAGIIIVVGCIDYIIHIIPNKLSEIKESFIEAKEGIKDFFKIENGTLVVDEELVDEMRKELVSKGIDMSAIGFDDEERNKNLKIFLEAEAATSTPKVLFNSNAGAIEFEKASGGKFDYIDPVTFKNMVNTNNINVQDKYTIEGDNFIYANVIKTEVNGQVTDIKVNTVTENYKTRVSQYAVPFEFFVVLCIQTNQPDFVVDLAEQVKKATIVLSVFDSTTVTTTEEKKSYDIHTEGIRKYSFTILKEEQGNIQEYKKEEWTEGVNRKIDPSVNGVNSGLLSPDMDYSGISLEDLKKLYISRYGEDEWYRNFLNLPLNNQRDVLVAKLQVDQENNVDLISPTVEIEDEHKEEETKTVITSTTSNLQVTRITNWLGQMEIGYSAKKSEPTYTYGEAGKDISYQDGEKKEVTPEKVLSKLAQTHVDFSERELEQELKEQGSNAQIEYRLDKVEAVNHDLYTQEINIKENIKENVVTTEYTVDPQKVNTEEGNRKMEIILELLRRPYKALGMQNNQIAGEMLTSGAEGLFKHLEENDRTRDLANVMRYILYLYSGTDYGVTEIDSLLLAWAQNANNSLSMGTSYWWPIGGNPPTTTTISVHLGQSYLDGQTHSGLDISANGKGENYHDVIAAYDGVVKEVVDGFGTGAIGVQDGTGFGNHIKILNADGNEAIYAHLYKNSIKVKVGDKVKQGQVLAKMGSSGNSSGPHLHFELRKNGSVINVEEYVNPNNPRPSRNALVQYIIGWEGTAKANADGTKYVVFDDGAGNPTVGHGIYIAMHKARFSKRGVNADEINKVGAEVDKQIVDDIFLEILSEKVRSVQSTTNGLNLEEYQQDALVDMSFQTGNINGFVEAYNQYGNTEALYTNYFKKRAGSMVGNMRRRRSEYILFSTGNYDHKGNDY